MLTQSIIQTQEALDLVERISAEMDNEGWEHDSLEEAIEQMKEYLSHLKKIRDSNLTP